MTESRNCLVCGKPITLVPSAYERDGRYGGKPSDYTAIFTMHARCAINKRETDPYKPFWGDEETERNGRIY